ncbi:terminase [Thioclava dalianensis]|uniref:Terminase n=1 Tax=Thioclava dalianensis TaxID=1185766 RepID=A0A074THK9_9RHOB|nr:phage terminase small subunit P27 family [Thioclava dalianensis]KEP68523.1 terminase [Thioclava dalianensis]SFN84179.1 phage terminase, small subunit, putative, P27 family [Thioclava dalianensis]
MRGTKPELRRDPEAVTDLGPPQWMPEDAAQEWERVMPILAERRILSVADLGSLENYCLAIGQVREMQKLLANGGAVIVVEGMPKRHPAVGIQADAMTRSRLLAAELGLTPVSRSRPAIREPDEGDDDDPLDIS